MSTEESKKKEAYFKLQMDNVEAADKASSASGPKFLFALPIFTQPDDKKDK